MEEIENLHKQPHQIAWDLGQYFEAYFDGNHEEVFPNWVDENSFDKMLLNSFETLKKKYCQRVS